MVNGVSIWTEIPFAFWETAFFVFGAIVGSLLNVCIHRMPRGESIVWPPSHCPHCNYSIPGYLNIPLITWLYLRGKCANCRAPISVRYFLVELLTGFVFLACWWRFGPLQPYLAMVYCLLLSGFIVASFIDLEFFIIPDEITLGGIVVGFLCSAAVPALHQAASRPRSLQASFLGIAVGAGLIYSVLRVGKLLFGRHKIKFDLPTKVIFTESGLELPDSTIPFEDIFYRKSDAIVLRAKTVELPDRCYFDVSLQLSPVALKIGDETINPEEVPRMEVMTEEIVIPREAMGLGDVKFMAAIGAFLGWQAVIFCLFCSACIGSVLGIAIIMLKKLQWSGRTIPYGPYIAMAATIWIFIPLSWQEIVKDYLFILGHIYTGTLPIPIRR